MDKQRRSVSTDYVMALKKYADYLGTTMGISDDRIPKAIQELTDQLLENPTEKSTDTQPIFSLQQYEEELEGDLWDAIDFIFENEIYHGHSIDEVKRRVLEKSADFADQLSEQYKHYKAMSVLLVKGTESPAN